MAGKLQETQKNADLLLKVTKTEYFTEVNEGNEGLRRSDSKAVAVADMARAGERRSPPSRTFVAFVNFCKKSVFVFPSAKQVQHLQAALPFSRGQPRIRPSSFA
jgi:hypothetical protein